LALLLAAIAVPLKKAFVQVTGEAIARSAVQQALKELLPAGALVSQQVEVGPNSISVQLFSTRQVSAEKQKQAEQSIEEHSRRKTTIAITSVASQSELAQMMERLDATTSSPPPAPAPPVETIDQMRADLLARVAPVLTAVWPAAVPLSGFDLSLNDQGVTLVAQYRSDRDLSPIALGMIAKQLQAKLNLSTLVLEAHRLPVGRERSPKRGTERR
jgi:hypothetical protein